MIHMQARVNRRSNDSRPEIMECQPCEKIAKIQQKFLFHDRCFIGDIVHNFQSLITCYIHLFRQLKSQVNKAAIQTK